LEVLPPAGNEFIERLYVRKPQVDTIKTIERFMTAHPENHHAILTLGIKTRWGAEIPLPSGYCQGSKCRSRWFREGKLVLLKKSRLAPGFLF
jgi:hypothetical protein